MEEIECRDCKYFEDPFCHYVGQDKEGRLVGGCPYGKELGTLEDLFGGKSNEEALAEIERVHERDIREANDNITAFEKWREEKKNAHKKT